MLKVAKRFEGSSSYVTRVCKGQARQRQIHRADRLRRSQAGRYAIDSGWTSKHSFPTERLLLQAYSPYQPADWKAGWRETGDHPLINRIPTIVKESRDRGGRASTNG